MKKRYRVELDVTVDGVDESKLLQIAREYYRKTGGAGETAGEDARCPRKIPAKQFVSDAMEAIMELANANDFFRKAGIEMAGVGCMELEPETMAPTEGRETMTRRPDQPSVGEKAPGGPDLDEFETGVYLCRWPNGEFSLVTVATRRDALVQLDEWAPGHPSQLFPMDSCMVDFRLSDEARIELGEFGEDTGDVIWKTAYPVLDKVRCKVGIMRPDGEYTRKGKEVIRKAVEQERTRLWDNQPVDPAAETEAGKDLQKKLGMAGPVADHYIQAGAKRVLESDTPKKGKPS